MCREGEQSAVQDATAEHVPEWNDGFVEQQTPTGHVFYKYAGQLVVPFNQATTYQLFRLDNQMKLVFVNDLQAVQSAASLVVNVGSSSDPPEVLGIAHALEHLLFMGTEKYPDEHDFEAFLTKYGGYTNASTYQLVTEYHFMVNNEGLDGALDRFSQFFIAPLLQKDSIEREIQAIESEYRLDIHSDEQRANHICQTTTCPESSLSKFTCGNQETLSLQEGELQEQLQRFFKQEYGANNMQLVVVAGGSLGDERELVHRIVDLFSMVPKCPCKPDVVQPHPMCKQTLGTLLRYQTIGTEYRISMDFALPDDSRMYSSDPKQYIVSLLRKEDPGSLQAFLRERNWMTWMQVSQAPSYWKSPRIFEILISATPAGFANYQQVVGSVFAFLRMAREHKVQEWYFRELQQSNELAWLHGESMYPVTVAKTLAIQMSNPWLRPEHAVSSSMLLYEYNPQAIADTMALLTPQNYRLCLGARDVFAQDSASCRTEKYLGVCYSQEALPDVLTSDSGVESLVSSQDRQMLQFPQPNPYLTQCAHQATAEKTTSRADSDRDVFQAPQLLVHNEQCELWIRRLDSMEDTVERGSISLLIECTNAQVTPRALLLGGLLVYVLQKQCAAKLNLARQAGIRGRIWYSDHHLCIRVLGVQRGLRLLLQDMLEQLRQLALEQVDIDVAWDEFKRSSDNAHLETPRSQVLWQQHILRAHPRWTVSDWSRELHAADAAALQAFVQEMLQLSYVRMLVVGQTDSEALGILEDARGALRIQGPIPHVLRQHMRAVDILPGTYLSRFLVKNPKNADSAVSFAIYATARSAGGRDDVGSQAALSLLEHIMGTAFFDQLRTKEQLGYSVSCTHLAAYPGGAGALLLNVQGKCTPDYMCLRIEQFLIQFRSTLLGLTPSQLAALKQARATASMQMPFKVASISNFLWPHIDGGRYDFSNKRQVNARMLEMSLEELLRFWDTFVDPLRAGRRATRVVVQAWADGGAPAMASEEVMRENPLPVIALHACLEQMGASEILLSDVSRFVATSGLPLIPEDEDDADDDEDTGELRLSIGEYQRRLAALYKAVVLEQDAANPQAAGKKSLAEIDHMCMLIVRDRSFLRTALQMALGADQVVSSLLSSQPARTPQEFSLPCTYAGAWIIPDHLCFKRMQPLCAPPTPTIRLLPKYAYL
ncbi:metalloprotease [Coemansia sp. RSA 2336]|nr:metalloprotease [Coemansia sp. RSA 2336]